MIDKSFNVNKLQETADLMEEICNKYQLGHNAYYLSELYKIPVRTIYDILEANNIPRRPRNNKGK